MRAIFAILLAIIAVGISTGNSETVPIQNLDVLRSTDLKGDELEDNNRAERFIFNIYRGTPANPYGTSRDSSSSLSLAGAQDGASGTTSLTSSNPFAGFRVSTAFLSPETRETLRALGRNLRQGAGTLFQSARSLLRPPGSPGSGSTFGSASSFNTDASSAAAATGSDSLSSNPTSGFRLTNLVSPETRDSLRATGTNIGQRIGRLLRYAQNGATRFLARYRPTTTTERSIISISAYSNAEQLNENE